MRWIWRHLPQRLVLRIPALVVLVVVVAVALHFVYEWMGDVLLDNGGAIG